MPLKHFLLSFCLLTLLPPCCLAEKTVDLAFPRAPDSFTFFDIPLNCKKSAKKLDCFYTPCQKKANTGDPSAASLPERGKKLFYEIRRIDSPLDEARAYEQKLDFLPEEKAMPGVSSFIYQCPNSSAVLFEQRYAENMYRLLQFNKNGSFEWLDYCNESSFKNNTAQLFNYICALSQEDFLNAAVFPSGPVKTPPNTAPPINVPSAAPGTPQAQGSPDKNKADAVSAQPSAEKWRVLGENFYPAAVPEHLLDVRRFETKNKSKEIRINFSSKDKKPFLEKLKITHRYHPAHQTDCAEGGILYETIASGIYQAWLLNESAITVYSAPYSLPTLPEEPHASRMQKEFCALDIGSKW